MIIQETQIVPQISRKNESALKGKIREEIDGFTSSDGPFKFKLHHIVYRIFNEIVHLDHLTISRARKSYRKQIVEAKQGIEDVAPQTIIWNLNSGEERVLLFASLLIEQILQYQKNFRNPITDPWETIMLVRRKASLSQPANGSSTKTFQTHETYKCWVWPPSVDDFAQEDDAAGSKRNPYPAPRTQTPTKQVKKQTDPELLTFYTSGYLSRYKFPCT